jgi:hypothetical protein
MVRYLLMAEILHMHRDSEGGELMPHAFSPYVYSLGVDGQSGPPAVFTWPNIARKYIRDTYTVDGELHLPPPGHLRLARYKVNPKAGQRPVADMLDVGEFLAG